MNKTQAMIFYGVLALVNQQAAATSEGALNIFSSIIFLLCLLALVVMAIGRSE